MDFQEKSTILREQIDQLVGNDFETLDQKVDLLYQLGMVYYYSRHNLEEGVGVFEQGLRISRAHDGMEKGEGQSLLGIGMTEWLRSNYAVASDFINQALALHERIGYLPGIALENRCLGIIQANTGDYAKADFHLRKALDIHQELLDESSAASDIYWLGYINYHLGDYAVATDFLLRALEQFKRSGKEIGQADAFNSLGLVFWRLLNHQRAEEFFRQALDIRTRHNEKNGIADTLNNLGMILATQNRFEEAVEHYQQSLQLQRELGARYKEANVLNNLANAKKALNRVDDAVSMHRQALMIRMEIGDIEGRLNSVLNMSGCLFESGMVDEAEKMLVEIIPRAEELGARIVLSSIADGMMRIAAAKQEWENAYRWSRRLLDERHGMLGEKQIISITDALANYLSSEKQKEADALRTKNQELKDSYDQLKQAHEEIIALEKRNATLAMAVTANHELNQPLMVAQGNLEMLMASLGDRSPLTDFQSRHLSRIHDALQRISHILEKFRHVSNFYEADYSELTKMIIFEDEPGQ
jgi:tetratricopeptide (TPR) repeat protein